MSALTNTFTAIANAIRGKTGKTETMTPAQMPAEIASISGNQDYVDCLTMICERPDNEHDLVFPDDIKKIRVRMQSWTGGHNNLNTVSAPGAEIIGEYAFQANTQLTTVNMPNAAYFETYAFDNCSNLQNLTIADKLHYVQSNAFARVPGMNFNELVFEEFVNEVGVTQLPYLFPYAFWNCTSLPDLKIKGPLVWNAQRSFAGCTFTKLWLSQDIRNMSQGVVNASAVTDIYTDATELQSGWNEKFAAINNAGTEFATVHYGVSEAEFDEIISGS